MGPSGACWARGLRKPAYADAKDLSQHFFMNGFDALAPGLAGMDAFFGNVVADEFGQEPMIQRDAGKASCRSRYSLMGVW